MTITRKALSRSSLFLLGAAALVLLGANGETTSGVQGVYPLDRQTTAYRSTISAVDSTGSASVATNVPDMLLDGRKNIPVSARFSDPDGTCKVRLYHYWKTAGGTYYFLGSSDEITLASSGAQDATGAYTAPTFVFDSMGARVVKVVVTQLPTSGTLNALWAGSF